MTTKLYWNDSHLTQFSARVADSWLEAGQRIVALDQTAFYPTGGGQPCDQGKIGSADVVDVVMADDGRILHRLDGDAPLAAGGEGLGGVERAWGGEGGLAQTGA